MKNSVKDASRSFGTSSPSATGDLNLKRKVHQADRINTNKIS